MLLPPANQSKQFITWYIQHELQSATLQEPLHDPVAATCVFVGQCIVSCLSEPWQSAYLAQHNKCCLLEK